MDVDSDDAVRDGHRRRAGPARIASMPSSRRRDGEWPAPSSTPPSTKPRRRSRPTCGAPRASSRRSCRPCAPREAAASSSSARSGASSPSRSRRSTASASSPSRDSGEALAYEVAPFGIDVTLVEPGNVRTDFTANRKMAASSSDDEVYRQRTRARAVGAMERDEANGVAADDVAVVVQKVLDARRPPRRVSVGKAGETDRHPRQTAASASRLRGGGQEQSGCVVAGQPGVEGPARQPAMVSVSICQDPSAWSCPCRRWRHDRAGRRVFWPLACRDVAVPLWLLRKCSPWAVSRLLETGCRVPGRDRSRTMPAVSWREALVIAGRPHR